MNTIRRLWLNSWTHKALLVGPERGERESNRWLPRSRVREVERVLVRHPLGDARAKGAPELLGTLLVLSGDPELFDRKGLGRDAANPIPGLLPWPPDAPVEEVPA